MASELRRRLAELASRVDGFVLTNRQPDGAVRMVLETEDLVGVAAVGGSDEDAIRKLLQRAESFDWPGLAPGSG